MPVRNVEAPRANLPQLFSWTENRISVSSKKSYELSLPSPGTGDDRDGL